VRDSRRAVSLVVTSIVRRRGVLSVALRFARPFDVQIVRLTNAKDSVRPLSFWKAVYRQYRLQMASTHSIMDASRRVCQFAYCRTQRPANAKRNSLLNLDFLGSCDVVGLKDNQRQPPKTNNDNRQKLTMEPTDSESPALYRGDPNLEGGSVVVRSSSGTIRPMCLWGFLPAGSRSRLGHF
jgi:hypothetical protein